METRYTADDIRYSEMGTDTRNYTFIWGMGGENQAFDDMDWVEINLIERKLLC